MEKENRENMIDPMDIWPTWHDRYPKVDLKGRHLWDLHPLCSETSLTSHGAESVFVGVADVSGSSTLDADCAFFEAICGGGSECTNAASVALNETLPCTGEECKGGVSYMKIGSVVYRYNRLTCVDLFVDPSPVAANDTGIRTRDGECQGKSGTPIRDGVVQLSGQTVKDECFGVVAWRSVRHSGGTGCCVSWTMRQAVGSGRTSTRCSSFSASVWITGFTYVNSSESLFRRTPTLGLLSLKWATGTVSSVARRRAFRRRRPHPFPAGCSRQGAEVDLQSSQIGVCRSHLTVDDKGTFTTNGVSYVVPWSTKGLPACEKFTPCLFTPRQSLTLCPLRPDVHDRLSINSVVPVLHCSVYDDDVKTVSEGGNNKVFRGWMASSTDVWNTESSLQA